MGGGANGSYGHEAFRRSRSHFTDRVTADGRDGWPVRAGRYRLVVSRACPWASRALVARRLLGLEDALSPAVADPVQDDRSRRFTLDPDGRDPVLGIRFLSEAYDRRETGHPGGVSVPALVDVPSGELVGNDYRQLTLDLATEWASLHRDGAPDLYPHERRDEIDAVMADVHEDVDDGVHRTGFATGQKEYEHACTAVYQRLELLSRRLEGQRYLVGGTITEADIRLFTTLVRFDVVSTRRPGSVTPSTSITSNGTTTRSTPASTRPGSSPSDRSCPAGSRPTSGRSWAGVRSVTGHHRGPCPRARRSRPKGGPER